MRISWLPYSVPCAVPNVARRWERELIARVFDFVLASKVLIELGVGSRTRTGRGGELDCLRYRKINNGLNVIIRSL